MTAKIKLRDYQEKAVNDLYTWMLCNPGGHPCLVCPTGAGKSVIAAELCRRTLAEWPESQILILTHVKELIEQDAEKILTIWPDAPLGVYCAGLKKRETGQITAASIQSIAHRIGQIGNHGYVDMVIIDEAHRINHEGEGQYRRLLDALLKINPLMRIIGLTATPYRMGQGLLTQGENALFTGIVDSVSIEELVEKGYLAPLFSKFTEMKLSVEGVHTRHGDYIESELQAVVNTDFFNNKIVEEVIARAEGRKAWLFFCVGVGHAYAMRDALRRHGINAETVVGSTPRDERDRILKEFKAGNITALTNANVLSTGFDYPNIDLIAMCRPTLSTSLYVQQAGRGMRPKEHTDNCLVFDFAGNVDMHGPVIDINPLEVKEFGAARTKKCKRCYEIVSAGARKCPVCGYVFEREETRRAVPGLYAHDDDIMGEDRKKVVELRGWNWFITPSRKTGAEMLCVDYIPATLTAATITEFFCLWHDNGYARLMACESLTRLFNDDIIAALNEYCIEPEKLANETRINWVERLSADLYENKDVVVDILNSYESPQRITVRREGQYYKVLSRYWPHAAA